MTKKVIGWGGCAFLLFMIAFRPDIAAGVFRSLGSGIADIVQGLGDFFTRLVA